MSGRPEIIFRWVLRIGIGALFIAAGSLKAAAPDSFFASLLAFQILPEPIAWILSRFLPFLEIVCGLALICGAGYRGALALLSLMTVCFTVVLASALVRGLDVTCGCLGSGDSTSLPFSIARNVLLLVAIGWLIWREKCRISTARPVDPVGR